MGKSQGGTKPGILVTGLPANQEFGSHLADWAEGPANHLDWPSSQHFINLAAKLAGSAKGPPSHLDYLASQPF